MLNALHALCHFEIQLIWIRNPLHVIFFKESYRKVYGGKSISLPPLHSCLLLPFSETWPVPCMSCRAHELPPFHLICSTAVWDRYYYPCSTYQETCSETGSHLLKVTQLPVAQVGFCPRWAASKAYMCSHLGPPCFPQGGKNWTAELRSVCWAVGWTCSLIGFCSTYWSWSKEFKYGSQ